MANAESVVDVSQYSNALARWWPVVAVATIVGVVLGSIAVQVQPTEYESKARVEVRPLVTQGDDPNLDVNRQVNTTTERAIAGSQRVAERALALMAASETLGLDDLDDPAVEESATEVEVDSDEARAIVESVTIAVPTDSQILEFTSANSSALRAQSVAQAMAHGYLDFRRDEGLSSTEQARIQLIEREAELLEELDELARAIGAAADEAERQSLSYQDVSKREELAGIGARLANISSISIDPGEVLDDANLPESEAGIPDVAGPLSGLLLGALLGAAVAYALDRQDDRFRNPSLELAQMGLHPMGRVSVGRGLFRFGTDRALVDVGGDTGEAYRRVQGSLMFNLDQSDKSVVLVSGTNNPHATTTVAANLAAAASSAGRRTLLIGADLRRPSLHERFDLPNEHGLTDVLAGRAQLDQALLARPDLPNLRLLPSGSPIDQPAVLLQSPSLGRLLAHVRDQFDLVVIEAPPVLQVADAVDLARLCEGAVLVVEPGRASRADVSDSVEQLRRVGADVVGTIVAESSPA